MCTTAAKFINNSWYLAKTRDPVPWMRWDDELKLFDTAEDKYKKLIVQNPDPHEDGYYGGINDRGVAFTSTYVRTHENQISYIRRPYVRLILDAATAREAVDIVRTFNPRIGGNMFVADPNECYGIEGVPSEYFIEKITKPSVKTNHYLHLDHPNLSFTRSKSFKAWSIAHQERAEELITNAESLGDLIALLQDRQNADAKNAICTTKAENPCFTHSAMIFDTRRKEVHYAQGNPLEVPFKKFGF